MHSFVLTDCLTESIQNLFQTNVANSSLSTIVSIQPKESSGGVGETRESVVWKMADEMLEKLPDDFLPHEVI